MQPHDSLTSDIATSEWSIILTLQSPGVDVWSVADLFRHSDKNLHKQTTGATVGTTHRKGADKHNSNISCFISSTY